jgi:hypothetical protein
VRVGYKVLVDVDDNELIVSNSLGDLRLAAQASPNPLIKYN